MVLDLKAEREQIARKALRTEDIDLLKEMLFRIEVSLETDDGKASLDETLDGISE